MSFPIERIKLGVSPITNTIDIVRVNKDETMWLEKIFVQKELKRKENNYFDSCIFLFYAWRNYWNYHNLHFE